MLPFGPNCLGTSGSAAMKWEYKIVRIQMQMSGTWNKRTLDCHWTIPPSRSVTETQTSAGLDTTEILDVSAWIKRDFQGRSSARPWSLLRSLFAGGRGVTE